MLGLKFRSMMYLLSPMVGTTSRVYREGDPRGAAARAFYRRMGFSEGKLGEEFGCPVQEFTLKGKPAGQR